MVSLADVGAAPAPEQRAEHPSDVLPQRLAPQVDDPVAYVKQLMIEREMERAAKARAKKLLEEDAALTDSTRRMLGTDDAPDPSSRVFAKVKRDLATGLVPASKSEMAAKFKAAVKRLFFAQRGDTTSSTAGAHLHVWELFHKKANKEAMMLGPGQDICHCLPGHPMSGCVRTGRAYGHQSSHSISHEPQVQAQQLVPARQVAVGNVSSPQQGRTSVLHPLDLPVCSTVVVRCWYAGLTYRGIVAAGTCR